MKRYTVFEVKDMKQKQLVIFLSVIIIIIAAITFIALKSIIGGKKPETVTEPLPDDSASVGTTPDNGGGENKPEAPASNQNNPDTKPDDNSNSKPDSNSDTKPDSNSNSKPNSNSDTKPDDKPDDKPSGNGTNGDNKVYNTSMPDSYKDFALTKGMSAKEAYEYLNGFLSSKYSILVNKEHKVGSDYEPSDLTVPGGCEYKMESTAAKALSDMLRAARADGYGDLVLYSGYRTYSSQKNKYETRTNKYLSEGYSQAQAEEKAGEYIAPPGSSEHHTGLAADVCSSKIVSKFGYLDDSFDTTGEYKWLRDHCSEYGFIMRYRKDAQSITGFLYEPWHYRYLGVDHAKACTALGVTYEEYHALLEKLRDEAKTDAGA